MNYGNDTVIEKKNTSKKKDNNQKILQIVLGIICIVVIELIMYFNSKSARLAKSVTEEHFAIEDIVSKGEINSAAAFGAVTSDESNAAGENYKSVLAKQEKIPESEMLELYDVEYDSGNHAGLIVSGKTVQKDDRSVIDGTLWYINGEKAEKLKSGSFFNTGHVEKVKDLDGSEEEALLILDYVGESKNALSVIYALKDDEIFETNISCKGFYNGTYGDSVAVNVLLNDSTYDLKTKSFAGLTSKDYYFNYSSKKGDFEECKSNLITQSDVYNTCGVDIIFEITEKGGNVINAFERDNGIITVNYYEEKDGVIIFNQANWEVGNKRYVVNNNVTAGTDLEKSGFGGICLREIGDLSEISVSYENLIKEIDVKKSFRNQSIVLGSKLNFGTYVQDGNGVVPEPVEWRVLDIKDGKALLLSEKIIDCEQYYAADTYVLWEFSNLRNYMGAVYTCAFTDVEKALIVPRTQDNVVDNVFALDWASVDQGTTGNGYQYPMFVNATAWAKSKGLKVSENGRNRWWTGVSNATQIGATTCGGVLTYGGDFNGNKYTVTEEFLLPTVKAGVRPAVWVKLD